MPTAPRETPWAGRATGVIVVRLASRFWESTPAPWQGQGAAYIRCSSDIAFENQSAALLHDGRLSGVAWEVSSVLRRPQAVPPCVLAAGAQVPLLLRVEPTPASFRVVAELAKLPPPRTVPEWQVFVAGYDDDLLARALEELGAGKRGVGPDQSILTAIADHVPAPVSDVVTGALTIGRRRTTVHTLAQLLGIQIRTLELRLFKCCALTPGDVLAWALVLHTAWRLDVLGITVKEAAYSAGYTGDRGTHSLREYVFRHTGQSLRSLAQSGAFLNALGSFTNLLRLRQ